MTVISNSGAAAAACSTHINPAPPLPITAISVEIVSMEPPSCRLIGHTPVSARAVRPYRDVVLSGGPQAEVEGPLVRAVNEASTANAPKPLSLARGERALGDG